MRSEILTLRMCKSNRIEIFYYYKLRATLELKFYRKLPKILADRKCWYNFRGKLLKYVWEKMLSRILHSGSLYKRYLSEEMKMFWIPD